MLDIKKKYKKNIIIYAVITIICVVFSKIYTIYTSGASSKYMSYSFLITLFFGVIGYAILYRKSIYNRVAYNMYNAAIATLVTGSLLKGIISISGEVSRYTKIYFILAVVMFCISGCIYTKELYWKKSSFRKNIPEGKKLKFIFGVFLLFVLLAMGTIYKLGWSFSLLSINEIESTRERGEITFENIKINGIELAYDKKTNRYYYTIPKKKEGDWYALKIEEPGLRYNIDGSKLNIVKVNYKEPVKIILYNDTNYYELNVQLVNTPIVKISTEEEKDVKWTYLKSNFTYINQNANKRVISKESKVKTRGGSSLQMPKKSYKVVTYDEEYNEEDKVIISNFYNGSKFVLDAVYKDTSKIRNVLSTELWNSMSKNRTNVEIYSEFVDVFINNEYYGLYVMTEPVTKGRFNLSKNCTIIKTTQWNLNPNESDIGNVDGIQYMDYEIKYPNDETLFKSVWDEFLPLMYDYHNKIHNEENIFNIFYEDDYIDMIIFNAFINNIDNGMQKNNYFYKKDSNDTKYHIQPWDLEYSFGLEWSSESFTQSEEKYEDYKEILTSFEHKESAYINQKLINRYWELRKTILTREFFDAKLNKYKEELQYGICERDSELYYDYDINSEIENIRQWVYNRLDYFDDYIRGLENE